MEKETLPEMTEDDVSPVVDSAHPHTARIWNYFLGGKDNYESDRTVAKTVLEMMPELVDLARADREFLRHSVTCLAGERQYAEADTSGRARRARHRADVVEVLGVVEFPTPRAPCALCISAGCRCPRGPSITSLTCCGVIQRRSPSEAGQSSWSTALSSGRTHDITVVRRDHHVAHLRVAGLADLGFLGLDDDPWSSPASRPPAPACSPPAKREPTGPWPLDAPPSSTAHRQSRNLGALYRPELASRALKGYG